MPTLTVTQSMAEADANLWECDLDICWYLDKINFLMKSLRNSKINAFHPERNMSESFQDILLNNNCQPAVGN